MSVLAAFLSAWVTSGGTFAATITLNDGRSWEGSIVREDKQVLVLETVGGRLKFDQRNIRSIDRSPTRREVYRQKLAAMNEADADQHYLLGLWCRKVDLPNEGDYHLNYALALEPDHEGARRALGYVKYEGRWVPEKEAKEAQGLRFYGGRWMTEEAAEIADLEVQVDALADAIADARTYPARREAVDQLLSLRDPLACPAIVGLLFHGSSDVRVAALRAVDKLKIAAADGEVLLRALYDVDAEVRARARRSLGAGRWNPSMLPETLKALRASDNLSTRFNAALLLAVVKPQQAIEPLIEALYVKYRTKPRPQQGALLLTRIGLVRMPPPPPPDTENPVVTDPVAGVVGAAPDRKPADAPDDRIIYMVNHAALDALRAITRKDFGVNKRAWRTWWDAVKDDFDVRKGSK